MLKYKDEKSKTEARLLYCIASVLSIHLSIYMLLLIQYWATQTLLSLNTSSSSFRRSPWGSLSSRVTFNAAYPGISSQLDIPGTAHEAGVHYRSLSHLSQLLSMLQSSGSTLSSSQFTYLLTLSPRHPRRKLILATCSCHHSGQSTFFRSRTVASNGEMLILLPTASHSAANCPVRTEGPQAP